MAAFPSVVVNTLKLEPDLKKLTPSTFSIDKKKYSNIAHLDHVLDPISLDLKEAREGNAKIEVAAYVPLLQECIHNNSVLKAQSIHAHMIKTGACHDVFIMTYLVNVYAKCGTMESAKKVFDNMPHRNVVSWTTLMSGYIHNSHPEVAVSVFLEMLEVGSYPNTHTLGIVLNACSLFFNFELGKQIHAYIVKYGIEYDTGIGNALCSLYSKSGFLDSAMKVFQMIGRKDVISWTTAISACVDNGSSAEGLDFFVQMLSEGVEPNEYTLTSVLSLCCVMQALGVALQVHSLSIKLGIGSSPRVRNSIMYLYLKTGQIKEAKKLFDELETLNLVTWNAMIAGHAEMIHIAEDRLLSYLNGIQALEIFIRLNRSAIKPDQFTFSSILTVCSSLAALEQGEQIHAQSIKTGWLSDVVVGTALVNMYSKSGSIHSATKAFVEMSNRTLISWTSMINAFAQNGQSQQALQLFEDMRFLGVRPNQVTFVGVLAACSHAGMVEEGLAYFEMMKSFYKISPVMDHYACLIDTFVRLGRLEEAFDFIKKMNFEPNEVIWSILVAGCRSHGKSELAFYAAEKLLSLNPQDSETYFYLLNMYLSAGRLQDVSRIRKMMKASKIGRIKDYSWISIRDKVYSFKPDDLQYAAGEVGEFLKDLYEKVKSLGYETQSILEMADEEGDETNQTIASSIVHHSEKFAVAFGLLYTPDAASIHVDKSISMCRDCHNFFKFASISTSRTIIIRDSKRLHKFVNGQCSCGDFGTLL